LLCKKRGPASARPLTHPTAPSPGCAAQVRVKEDRCSGGSYKCQAANTAVAHGALEEVLAAEMFMRDRAVAAACGIRRAVGLTIDQGWSPSGARECFKSLVSSGGGGKEA